MKSYANYNFKVVNKQTDCFVLLISGTLYQITLWRLTLLIIMYSRIVLINTGLIKMKFMTTNQI